MKRILFFLAVSFSFLFVACDDDDNNSGPGDLTLKVTATYDSEPLVNLDATYDYPDGSPLRIQLFNYYLSDIRLYKEGAPAEDAQLLSEVELIQYDDTYTAAEALAGKSFTYKNIPDGVYSGLRIGLGLTADLNATQPGDYEDGHPMSNNFWSWARGYVFTKLEAKADLDGDGEFTDNLTYHIGQNDLYKVIELPQTIKIENGKVANAHINVDLAKMLKNASNEYLDITVVENTLDHTINEDIFRFLYTNLGNAVEIVE